MKCQGKYNYVRGTSNSRVMHSDRAKQWMSSSHLFRRTGIAENDRAIICFTL